MSSRIVKDSSDLEGAMKPFLDAANTEDWKVALSFLYINGSVLSLIEEPCVPVLISMKGEAEDEDKIIDLLMGRAKTDLIPLIGVAAEMFLPKALVLIQKTISQQSSEGKKIEGEMIAFAAAMQFKPVLESNKKMLTELMIQGALSVSDMIGASVFQNLLQKRDQHIDSSMDEEEYEEMVNALSKLGVTQPRLQVSLCSRCANYELIISSHPGERENCTKCGGNWTTLTLFTVKPPLDKIKASNSDLPLFISSYLRFAIKSKTLVANARIIPKAEILNDSGEKAEVDVLLPEFNLGIECKAFQDRFGPFTKGRIDGIVGGQLIPQIKRYLAAKITNIVIVTNLPQEPTQKLKNAVEQSLSKEQAKPTSIEFIDGSVDSLLKFFDTLSDKYAQGIQAAISKQFEVQLSSETELSKGSNSASVHQSQQMTQDSRAESQHKEAA